MNIIEGTKIDLNAEFIEDMHKDLEWYLLKTKEQEERLRLLQAKLNKLEEMIELNVRGSPEQQELRQAMLEVINENQA